MNRNIDAATGTAEARRVQVFRRGTLETIASSAILAGVVMLMQPFSMTLYGWSFVTTLAGTVLFAVAGRFPE